MRKLTPHEKINFRAIFKGRVTNSLLLNMTTGNVLLWCSSIFGKSPLEVLKKYG